MVHFGDWSIKIDPRGEGLLMAVLSAHVEVSPHFLDFGKSFTAVESTMSSAMKEVNRAV